MKTNINSDNNLILFFATGKHGERVKDTMVYLETESGRLPVAFQKTGKAGKVTFAYLDKGVYKIMVALLKQSGRLAAENSDIQGDLDVAYHSGKKIYFIHEPQGFFTLKFSKLKNLNDSNITPMHEKLKEEDYRIVVGKFEVDRKYGSLTMKISAYKPKSFQKRIEKYRHDSEMAVIRGKQANNQQDLSI